MGKHAARVVWEDVIVKDNGRQGLAIFVPAEPASPGCINVFDTMLSYVSMLKGFRPNMLEVPCSYEEASMGYFQSMRKPKADDPRVEPFLERYRKWAQSCYTAQPCELHLRRVSKDTQKYRDARWQR